MPRCIYICICICVFTCSSICRYLCVYSCLLKLVVFNFYMALYPPKPLQTQPLKTAKKARAVPEEVQRPLGICRPLVVVVKTSGRAEFENGKENRAECRVISSNKHIYIYVDMYIHTHLYMYT